MKLKTKSVDCSHDVKTPATPNMLLLTPDLTSTRLTISPINEKQIKRLISLLKRRRRLWEDIPLNNSSTSFFQEKCIILSHEVLHTNERTGITRVNVRAYAPKLDALLSFHYDVTNLRDKQIVSLRNSSSYTCCNIAKFHPNDIITLFKSSDDLEDFIEKVTGSEKPSEIIPQLF